MKISKDILSDYIKDPEWLNIIWNFMKLPKNDKESNGDWIFSQIKYTKESYKKPVFPESNDCFNAFNYCPYNKLKVVILGQDPYHTKGIADGLAFSSKKPFVVPPSLTNIFQEIEDDVYGGELLFDQNPNLKRWAEQGILLLNTSLTVLESEPESHLYIWKDFTNYILSHINMYNPGTIFLLWGNHAKKFTPLITPERHHILTSGHPSPLSANQGKWFGNKHFSTVNKILHDSNGPNATIKWYS